MQSTTVLEDGLELSKYTIEWTLYLARIEAESGSTTCPPKQETFWEDCIFKYWKRILSGQRVQRRPREEDGRGSIWHRFLWTRGAAE